MLEITSFLTVGITRFDELIESIFGDMGKRLHKSPEAKAYTHFTVQSRKYPVN